MHGTALKRLSPKTEKSFKRKTVTTGKTQGHKHFPRTLDKPRATGALKNSQGKKEDARSLLPKRNRHRRSFAKTFHSLFLGVRGKCLWPCVFPVVTVLRLNDFSVFGLRRLSAVPCIHYWKDVWCRMFCSHDVGGGEWCLWDFSLVSVVFW